MNFVIVGRWFSGYIPVGASKKKESGDLAANRACEGAGDSLAAFHDRLRDLCGNHRDCDGSDDEPSSEAQAKHAVALAAQLGCLREPCISWEEFLTCCPDAIIGTEHMVELDASSGRVGKTTIPPAFGLVPKVLRHQNVRLRDAEAGFREVIEFVSATPLQYLARWIASNEVFGDEVRLACVILWKDGLVSFGITQPQYHGVPAEQREIEAYFKQACWTRLNDSSGHAVFFNYAFGVIAIDAEKRNCYLNEGGLQPFDVILCRPDPDMERLLHIYPDRQG